MPKLIRHLMMQRKFKHDCLRRTIAASATPYVVLAATVMVSADGDQWRAVLVIPQQLMNQFHAVNDGH